MTDHTPSRDRSLNLASSPIEIDLLEKEPAKFSVLSIADVDEIRSFLTLDPIPFAIATLAHQAKGGIDADRLEELPRPTLLRACREWGAHPATLSGNRSEIRRFSDFRSLAEDRIGEWDESMRQLGKQLGHAIPVPSPIPSRVGEQLRKIHEASQTLSRIVSDFDRVTESITRSFRNALPDVAQIEHALREADRGKAHLDDHGYGFAVGDFGIPFLREVARERPDSREVHRAFLALTRRDEFGESLSDRILKSPTLARRAPIIQSAYSAHLSRNYEVSVPTLYAQLEGVLTDLLVLENLARRQGHRAVRAGTGKELRGLAPKAEQYGRRQTVVRQFITEQILKDLSPDRNAILHGSKTGYRQAWRSARLLLLIDVLSKVIARIES